LNSNLIASRSSNTRCNDWLSSRHSHRKAHHLRLIGWS